MRQSNLFGEGNGHIGTDESGKGDYFGPLVTAGFYLPDDQVGVVKELGVRDSKKISDNRVKEIAGELKKGFIHSIVSIGPEKYNELYLKLRNLNKILAWAHSRAIENILLEVPCTLAVTDQFGDQLFVRNAMMKRGRDIELVQKTGAEEDLAVAAASILARSDFLWKLFYLSREYGLEIPKGSSPRSEEVGVELVEKHGEQILQKIAKAHFKLTQRILNVVNDKK